MCILKFLRGFLLLSFLSSSVCIAKEGPLMFGQDIEHYGKGMIEYNLPTAIKTGYKPQKVGYWLSAFDVKPNGENFIILEVILYGSDFKTGRHVNTVTLKRGESCLVFFHSKEKHPNWKNIPQYCYIQIMDIKPSEKYVKMRHWVSRRQKKGSR